MAEIDTLRGSHETIHVVRVKTPFRSIRYSSWSSRDCIPTMRVSRMHPLGCWSLVLVLLQPHTPICVHGCDDYDLSGTVIVNHASSALYRFQSRDGGANRTGPSAEREKIETIMGRPEPKGANAKLMCPCKSACLPSFVTANNNKEA